MPDGEDEIFGVIDNRSLVDRVESKLVTLLQQKRLKVGDPIPKELELSESLGVSRTVVREALTRLRLMGLIESKKKRGTVITSPDVFGNLSKSMNPYILDDGTLKDLFELRLVLEIGMADLLFERIKDGDIADLHAIVDSEPAQPKYHLFNIDHEIAFHGKLYEIAGNEALKKFQKLLLPVFGYVQRSGLLKKQGYLETFVSHKDLVSILETGNAEQFREGMRNHLENHFARLFD